MDAASATKGFKYNASATAPHYTYDANGNMTQDNHKFLTIQYNHLNLPNSMYHPSDNTIVVTYTADCLFRPNLTTHFAPNLTTLSSLSKRV
ncbi:MAG: hypothetical protein ABMA02_14495 [Saprospiraceae bacterium]